VNRGRAFSRFPGASQWRWNDCVGHALHALALKAWLDVATPYQEFVVQCFKNAANSDSPLTPFSPESEHARVAAISVYREVLAGRPCCQTTAGRPARVDVAGPDGALPVPDLRSDRGCERSYRLAERGARLTAPGVTLARFRVLRPLVHEVHELFTDFLPGMTNQG
jgi:hypothetical protein